MLLEDGWHVIGVSRSYPFALLETDMERFGWLRGDVGQGRLRWQLADHLGDYPLDALVHAAAVRPAASLLDATSREWLETVNVFCFLITICAIMGSVQLIIIDASSYATPF